MKKSVALLLTSLITTSVHSAHADESTDAGGAVLCLAGIIHGGTGGGSCAGYMAKYFSIVKFHNGHFDLSGTSAARNAFTAQCSGCDAKTRQEVSDRYGASRGL